MRYSAHTDTFGQDNLPPRSEWPEFLFELPELQYPARLNCATELLDKPVTRGYGHRVALRAADAPIRSSSRRRIGWRTSWCATWACAPATGCCCAGRTIR
jgi:hypothetical protein